MNKLITEIAENALKIGNGASTESIVKYALNKYHDRLIEKVAADSSAISCHAEMWLKQQRGE